MKERSQRAKRKTKKKIQLYDAAVFLVRLGFFLFFPALFSSAFTGIKEIIISISKLKSLEWTAFAATLVLLLAVTICFGRIFCGFACAFGTYGDFLYFLSSWVRRKCKKQPFHVFARWQDALKYLKYAVLFTVLALCAMGFSSAVSANSPWTAFSLLHAGKLPTGKTAVVLLVLISVGMLLEPRFFCRFLCPMGAVFAMMPVFAWAVMKRDRESCLKGCSLCKRTCPAAIEIPDVKDEECAGTGECFACRKCMRRCPKKNISQIRPLTNRKP